MLMTGYSQGQHLLLKLNGVTGLPQGSWQEWAERLLNGNQLFGLREDVSMSALRTQPLQGMGSRLAPGAATGMRHGLAVQVGGGCKGVKPVPSSCVSGR